MIRNAGEKANLKWNSSLGFTDDLEVGGREADEAHIVVLIAIEIVLDEGSGGVDPVARVGESGLEGCENLLMVVASGFLPATNRIKSLNDDLEREVVLKRGRKEDRSDRARGGR